MTHRAAIYLRVSTRRQDEHRISIPDQQERCLNFCRDHGWSIAGIFLDRGYSGRTGDRPDYKRLCELSLGESPAFDVIVVHSLSRLYRNVDALVRLRQDLLERRIAIRSVSQDFGPDGSRGWLFLFHAIADEGTSKTTGEDTCRTMKQNAARGYWNGGRPPFGYKTVEAERWGHKIKRRLAIDPEKADIVLHVYDRFLNNAKRDGRDLSLRELALRLNADGCRYGDGSRWCASLVRRVLTSEAYTGRYRLNMRAERQPRPDQFPELAVAPRKEITMQIPRIISKEMFAAAQAKLLSRSPSKIPPRLVRCPTLLTGLAFCGDCGRPMVLRTGRAGRYSYYACSGRPREGCDARWLRTQHVNQMVLNRLAEHILAPELVPRQARALLVAQRSQLRRPEVTALGVRIATEERRIRKITTGLGNGELRADETVRDILLACAQRRDAAIRELAALAPPLVMPPITRVLTNHIADAIRMRLGEPDSDAVKKVLEYVVKKVILTKSFPILILARQPAEPSPFRPGDRAAG